MTVMIPQCYSYKLHEQGTKCAKYDKIAPEILVNLRKCTFKEDIGPGWIVGSAS
ncbi:MAG: hypothetical protein ACXVIU_11850 [Halobacteriota archaeon]